MMKVPLLLVFWLLVFPMTGTSEFRAFTNDNGDVINAELVSQSKGKVTLRRQDGKQFTVDPSVFCDNDQDYISKWLKKNPEEVRYNLVITCNKKKVEGNSQNLGYKRVKNDLWSYIISVKNNSVDTVSGLTIQYRMFFTNNADGYYSSYSSDGSAYKMIEGSVKMDTELKFSQVLDVTTTPVQIDLVDYSYSRSRYRDELKGCLIQIVDSNNKSVMEWASSEASMKGKTWANTDPNNKDKGGSAVVR
jgi:hypothetical protein